MPIDEFLAFEIVRLPEEKVSMFDQNPDPTLRKKVLTVEFIINDSRFPNRKAWKDFLPFWPKAGSEKTTQLFDLVAAVDPDNAVKGQPYDTDNLVGKKGRLMMANYESKKRDENNKPIIKQKVDRILPLTTAAAAPVAAAAAVEAPVAEATSVKKRARF